MLSSQGEQDLFQESIMDSYSDMDNVDEESEPEPEDFTHGRISQANSLLSIQFHPVSSLGQDLRTLRANINRIARTFTNCLQLDGNW